MQQKRLVGKVNDDERERHWDELAAQLRTNRREHGIAPADAQWVRIPFRTWLTCLDRYSTSLDPTHGEALAVGMRESLAMRDALIVSLVAQRGLCDEEMMIGFASRPHDPDNVRRMYRLLEQAFEDEDAVLDLRRCRTGIAMIRTIADQAPNRFRAQPLAFIGYIRWWMGSENGLPAALEALSVDHSCTLASIVRTAYEHDIHPANARRRAAAQPGGHRATGS